MRDQSENACCFLQVLELFSVVNLDIADQCQGVNTETSVSTETMDKISVAWQYYGNEKNISHLMVQKFPCILNTQKQS